MIIAARLHPALQGVLLLLALQLPMGLLMVTPAQAATYDVTTTSDLSLSSGGTCPSTTACSLRAAIQTANNEDPTAKTADIINLPAGSYTLTRAGANENAASTGDLDVTSEIVIQGTGNPIIDGNGTDRVFQVTSGGKLTLSNLTIQGGAAADGGGGIYNAGTVEADGVTIKNNTATRSGGGVYNAGTMTLSDTSSNRCVVSNNLVITDLSADGGGGVFNSGFLTITNCTFDSNEVKVSGTSSGSPTPGGGALQNEASSGIGASSNNVTITGSTFSNNKALVGGGIRNLFGAVHLENSEVNFNTSDFEGGGIENTGDSEMTILTAVVSNNIGRQNGGGIANLGGMKITNTAIYRNSSPGINPGAGGAGGGVFNGGNGVLTLVSTTISQNSARLGGGLYNHKEASITNATIYDNTATSTTAPLNNPGSEVFACGNKDETAGTDCSSGINDSSGAQIIHTRFVNTIVGNSTTATNCGGDVTDLIISQGHNLETANTCQFHASGDQPNTDPGFNTGLAWNQGSPAPDQLTYSLGVGSAAHNAADTAQCPEQDQRGYQRFESSSPGCDIGAYEISTHQATSLLDLALGIQYQNKNPQNSSVQTTISFTVANTSSDTANHVVLTIKIPTLSWLNVTSVGADDSSGSCAKTSVGVTCTLPSLGPTKSYNFFVATTASQSGAFTVDGEVSSDAPDNFTPDNHKSVTITIPTVSGAGSGSNNFGGSSGGGGGVDWLALMALLIPAARRLRCL